MKDKCQEARQIIWFVDTTVETRPMVVVVSREPYFHSMKRAEPWTGEARKMPDCLDRR